MSVCKAAEKHGIFVLHGSRSTFHTNRQPAFKAVYRAWEEVSCRYCGGVVRGLHEPLLITTLPYGGESLVQYILSQSEESRNGCSRHNCRQNPPLWGNAVLIMNLAKILYSIFFPPVQSWARPSARPVLSNAAVPPQDFQHYMWQDTQYIPQGHGLSGEAKMTWGNLGVLITVQGLWNWQQKFKVTDSHRLCLEEKKTKTLSLCSWHLYFFGLIWRHHII